MVELKIQLDEINYEEIVQQLLPFALEKLSGNFGNGKLGPILGVVSKLPPKAAAGMLAALPQDTKDELAVLLLNLKKDSIMEAAGRYAESKHISLKIRDVQVTKL